MTRHERSHEHAGGETAENMGAAHPRGASVMGATNVTAAMSGCPSLRRPVSGRAHGGALSPAPSVTSARARPARRALPRVLPLPEGRTDGHILRQRIRRKDDTTQCQKWRGDRDSSNPHQFDHALCSKVGNGAFSAGSEKRRRVHREKDRRAGGRSRGGSKV